MSAARRRLHGEPGVARTARALDDLGQHGRRRHLEVRENAPSEHLVAGDLQRVRVGPDEWDAELLEERRIERRPRPPLAARGDVDDEVRRRRLEARYQPRDRAGDLDPLDLVSRPRERGRQSVDDLHLVELALGLRVMGLRIVRQRDVHRFFFREGALRQRWARAFGTIT